MDRLYAIKKPLEYSDVLKKNQLMRSLGIGRECSYRGLENPGIAKIGLNPPLPQSWHSGGFDDKSA